MNENYEAFLFITKELIAINIITKERFITTFFDLLKRKGFSTK